MDMWALGVTIYMWMFGELPFIGSAPFMVYENIKKQVGGQSTGKALRGIGAPRPRWMGKVQEGLEGELEHQDAGGWAKCREGLEGNRSTKTQVDGQSTGKALRVFENMKRQS